MQGQAESAARGVGTQLFWEYYYLEMMLKTMKEKSLMTQTWFHENEAK